MPKKYTIKKTKKEANKALTAATRTEKFVISGTKPTEVKVITLSSLQTCLGWQKKNCDRVKPIVEKLGYKPFVKGNVKFLAVQAGRTVIDFVFANKA